LGCACGGAKRCPFARIARNRTDGCFSESALCRAAKGFTAHRCSVVVKSVCALLRVRSVVIFVRDGQAPALVGNGIAALCLRIAQPAYRKA
jgi:hypothetical protein